MDVLYCYRLSEDNLKKGLIAVMNETAEFCVWLRGRRWSNSHSEVDTDSCPKFGCRLVCGRNVMWEKEGTNGSLSDLYELIAPSSSAARDTPD